MAKPETSGKQPKKRSRVGIVLLVILLILAGGAGYLYYSIFKAPLELDDPVQMAASAPMPAGERFTFSAADRTVQVKLDAADLWSVILPYTGNDFLETINQELTDYNLTVSGCAIHMDADGVRLDLELNYQETRLVARIPCDLEISGQELSLKPTGAKLGVVSLPVQSLLSNVKLEYGFTLPVISEVTEVGFAEGAILLTGPMKEDMHLLVPQNSNLYLTTVFNESLRPLADALYTEDGFAAMLSQLEQNPGSVEDFYRQLFVLAETKDIAEYLDSRHGLTERFFPGIDFSAIEEEQAALSEQVTDPSRSLELFFNSLATDYNDKKFTLSNGEFLQKKKPFQAAQYGGKQFEALFELLDPDSVFLVLVHVENSFLRKTSSFYRMADENLEFTQPVDYNKTYTLGCVFRSMDGNPFVMYETETHEGNTYVRNITLQPLTEEKVSALQVPGKFGVWTG